MLGAIIGDIVGSAYEWNNIKTKDFPLFTKASHFTDDTVMTLAVSEACVGYQNAKTGKYWQNGSNNLWFQTRLLSTMQAMGRMYPDVGYGANFDVWINSDDPQPYNSYGNGSAMRVSPVAYFSDTLEEALTLARLSAEVTHNHPDGIRGAQATAACVFMALNGDSKSSIRSYVEKHFYSLNFTLDEIRPVYRYDVSCQGSVPQAIKAFLEGEDFEDTIRGAVSIGGDSDTIAAIAGSIAEPFFRSIRPGVVNRALDCLDEHLLSVYERGVKLRPHTYL